MSSSAAADSSPKQAELAVQGRAQSGKPRGSSYDADELNEIRNLSLGDDEGAAAAAATGGGFRRGRRGSGGGGGGGRKFEKGRKDGSRLSSFSECGWVSFTVKVSLSRSLSIRTG